MKYFYATLFLCTLSCSLDQKQTDSVPSFIYPFESWADIDGEYFSQNCGNGSYSEQTLTQLSEWYESGVKALTKELSEKELISISNQTHSILINQFPRKNDKEYRRVSRVFKKLKAQVPGTYKSKLEVYLLSSSMVYNAFAAPGGKCYITTSLLNDLKNDDELAFVLAHEIAHQIKEHGNMAARQHKYLIENLGDTGGEIADVVLSFVTTPFNINEEYEADQGGLWLMSEAGFNPEKGLMILSRWVEMEKNSKTKSILRTHPAAYKRFGCCSTLTAEAKERGEDRIANQ